MVLCKSSIRPVTWKEGILGIVHGLDFVSQEYSGNKVAYRISFSMKNYNYMKN